jgi:hypothetical protein
MTLMEHYNLDEVGFEPHYTRYEGDEDLVCPCVSVTIVPGTGQFVESRDED